MGRSELPRFSRLRDLLRAVSGWMLQSETNNGATAINNIA